MGGSCRDIAATLINPRSLLCRQESRRASGVSIGSLPARWSLSDGSAAQSVLRLSKILLARHPREHRHQDPSAARRFPGRFIQSPSVSACRWRAPAYPQIQGWLATHVRRASIHRARHLRHRQGPCVDEPGRPSTLPYFSQISIAPVRREISTPRLREVGIHCRFRVSCRFASGYLRPPGSACKVTAIPAPRSSF